MEETMTTLIFVPTIIDRVGCEKHGVPKGVPCFHIWPSESRNGALAGICNRRAREAGVNGQVNPTSIEKF